MNDMQDSNKENVDHAAQNENCPEGTAKAQNEAEVQMTELEKEIVELKNQLALARADFYNYRQRVEKDKTRLRASISEDRARDFFPVIDNLERALNVPEDSTASDVLRGVKMVHKQFLSVLQDIGVEVIAVNVSEGLSEFDPLLHEAVGTEEVTDPNLDGKILQELLKGYRANDKVLRPSKVRVGKLITASND